VDTFSVNNWDEFQHYKHRNPPWIKLHNRLLNNYEFSCLQDASKLHLMLIWMLASQLENKIPADTVWLKNRLGICTEPNLKELLDKGFITYASNTLASCKQSALLVEKSRVEKRGEKPQQTKHNGSKQKFIPPSVADVIAYTKTRKVKINPDKFVNYYQSKGWMLGKNKIKDWRACVRTWELNQNTEKQTNTDLVGAI